MYFLSRGMAWLSRQRRWSLDCLFRHGKMARYSANCERRPRVLIVGSGWGGFTLMNDIDRKKFDVQVLSPLNHFLFTPLLPSSVVGTLEFRAIQEPVRTVKNLGAYYQAKALKIDVNSRKVFCREVFEGQEFEVGYDFLVLAPGAQPNTFNTPGISTREGKEIFFLKHLHHARQIRNRMLECFERASFHQTNAAERDRLLTFVVVGGGPTNCELLGEMYDFIVKDVSKWYADLVEHISLHLIERSPRILASFESGIADAVHKRFESRGIKVHCNVSVKSFDAERRETVLSNAVRIPTGLMVWSAGLRQTEFIEKTEEFLKGPSGRILIDEYLMVNHQSCDNRVFAIGDCAVNAQEPLSPLAQAASQQARYLAKLFNNAPPGVGVSQPAKILRETAVKPFRYFSLGSMLTFGGFKGALDLTAVGEKQKPVNVGRAYGLLSFFLWRSAYFLKQNSWVNRILIPAYWLKSFVLGRDISRF